MAVKKVKVKIAVAVGIHGDWYAIGCSNMPEKEAWEIVIEQFKNSGPPVRYWVTAELTVPEVKTVKASEVEQVESETNVEGS